MITVENKFDSGVVLLQHAGKSEKSILIPFAFPSERKDIVENQQYTYLTRVPMTEVSAEAIIPTDGAREEIPMTEAMGKEFEAYLVESSERRVNGVMIDSGTSLEDAGIIFIAS